MSASWVRYWVARYLDGGVSAVVRIRRVEGEGLWTEFIDRTGAGWYDDGYAYTYLYDPLAGDEITEEEARRIVEEELGFTWHPPPPVPG